MSLADLPPLPPPPPAIAAAATAPTTTVEENLHTLGQRRINFIWEATQSLIAIAVTGATLYVAATLAVHDAGMTAAFLLLSNAFFLVIGFYFGRTNHTRVGGIGGSTAGER